MCVPHLVYDDCAARHVRRRSLHGDKALHVKMAAPHGRAQRRRAYWCQEQPRRKAHGGSSAHELEHARGDRDDDRLGLSTLASRAPHNAYAPAPAIGPARGSEGSVILLARHQAAVQAGTPARAQASSAALARACTAALAAALTGHAVVAVAAAAAVAVAGSLDWRGECRAVVETGARREAELQPSASAAEPQPTVQPGPPVRRRGKVGPAPRPLIHGTAAEAVLPHAIRRILAPAAKAKASTAIREGLGGQASSRSPCVLRALVLRSLAQVGIAICHTVSGARGRHRLEVACQCASWPAQSRGELRDCWAESDLERKVIEYKRCIAS